MVLQRVTQTLSALCGRVLDQDATTTMAIDGAFRDEAEELGRRLHNAEEQAAAAWSTCAALQKALEELRHGWAQDMATTSKHMVELERLTGAEFEVHEGRIAALEGHPGLL